VKTRMHSRACHHPSSTATRLSRRQHEYRRASLMRPAWRVDNDVDGRV
jgi:hypothetical protein